MSVSVALVNQHAKRPPLMLPSVACLVPPYFSTLSHKRLELLRKKKVVEYKMCALIFSTNSCKAILIIIYMYMYVYTGCPRRNVQYFGRVFLMLNYTDITQNTYVQS
jgi:hypothetical protein